jgi:hypothetical protein
MAQLFLLDAESRWAVLPLAAPGVLLTADGPEPAGPARTAEEASAELIPLAPDGKEWALLGSAVACHVNGEPLNHHLKALSHMDEIRVTGKRYFFSDEKLVRKQPFPQAAKAPICPRCQLPIQQGQNSVVCPVCGTAYHEIEPGETDGPRQCWTYGKCLFDSTPGVLDAGFRWTPEEL